ncbi:hypothetical protein SpCBS45565_g00485 [Spizellomyces sp. 'palustris']|nr:hypothetical protein SpCBS45565_g00485 [Spizellomyces sp. 'palustris']
MDVAFQDISYSITRKGRLPCSESLETSILRNLTARFKCGHLVGILGESGSGKSTLIDILAGVSKMGNVSGHVLYNGILRTKSNEVAFHPLIGYIPQDDVFMPNLTARETLLYSVQLRVPNLNRCQQQERVNEVLNTLNLTYVAETRVGDPLKRGISGGERRRLSIGVELVAYPALLLCDEITSGLDAFNALNTMRTLRTLCDTGKHTVVCAIHQPRSSIFAMFDDILLLASGRCVYAGSSEDMMTYFETMGLKCPVHNNPADWALDVVEISRNQVRDEMRVIHIEGTPDDKFVNMRSCTNDGSESDSAVSFTTLVSTFETSGYQTGLKAELRNLCTVFANNDTRRAHEASLLRQTLVLTRRLAMQTRRDKVLVAIRFFTSVLLGLLGGFMFFPRKHGAESAEARVYAINYVICAYCFSCVPTVTKAIEDRVLFIREHSRGCASLMPYLLACAAIELPVLLINALIFSSITYWMIDFYKDVWHFLFFIMVVTMSIFAGFSAAQMCASAVNSAMHALVLLAGLSVYQFLLAGTSLPKSDIGVPWLFYTSHFYFGANALILN